MAQTDPQNSERDRVIVFDTTLRDAEQTPGASLTVRDKLEIAHQLARLQVDVIEAGFPISSNEDFQVAISAALAGLTEAEVDTQVDVLPAADWVSDHTWLLGGSAIHCRSNRCRT